MTGTISREQSSVVVAISLTGLAILLPMILFLGMLGCGEVDGAICSTAKCSYDCAQKGHAVGGECVNDQCTCKTQSTGDCNEDSDCKSADQVCISKRCVRSDCSSNSNCDYPNKVCHGGRCKPCSDTLQCSGKHLCREGKCIPCTCSSNEHVCVYPAGACVNLCKGVKCPPMKDCIHKTGTCEYHKYGECNPIWQDCPSPKACYWVKGSKTECGKPNGKNLTDNYVCDYVDDCAKGYSCFKPSGYSKFICKRICVVQTKEKCRKYEICEKWFGDIGYCECVEDYYSKNHSFSTAEDLHVKTSTPQTLNKNYPNLRICPVTQDWFRLYLHKKQRITVTVTYDKTIGDIDLTYYVKGDLNKPENATEGNGNETFSYLEPEGKHVYVKVHTPGTQSNIYAMNVVVSPQNCSSKSYKACVGKDLYWYNSCGVKDSLVQKCNNVCLNGKCCTPSCKGKSCGVDGCGGTCGSCPKGSHCDTSAGTCQTCKDECTSKYTSKCVGAERKQCNDYNGDGCLEWKTVQTCAKSSDCTIMGCLTGSCDTCTFFQSKCHNSNTMTFCHLTYDYIKKKYCYVWNTMYLGCSGGQKCVNGSCATAAGCKNTCSPGQTKCEKNSTTGLNYCTHKKGCWVWLNDTGWYHGCTSALMPKTSLCIKGVCQKP